MGARGRAGKATQSGVGSQGPERQRSRFPTRSLLRAFLPSCPLALLLLSDCTDPRARPVPPLVQMTVSPTFQLNSPGTVLASLYVYDQDGLAQLLLSVRSSDSSLVGDSIIGLPGDPELTRVVGWAVPPGLAVGTQVALIAKVVDYTGFVTSYTIKVPVVTTSVRAP